jgi:Protein of unknown function (DUF2842)
MNHPNPPPKPSWRKPAGMLAILVMIAALAWLVGSLSEPIGALPIVLQALIYLIAGTIWIAPLRPLMIWMETGKWRE